MHLEQVGRGHRRVGALAVPSHGSISMHRSVPKSRRCCLPSCSTLTRVDLNASLQCCAALSASESCSTLTRVDLNASQKKSHSYHALIPLAVPSHGSIS